MRWLNCGLPKRKKTARGMRCVQICGKRIRYVKNGKCGLQTWAERHGLGCGCGK